jgi:hypothetical protein
MEIYWKVFGRSCGPQIRSVRLTVRLACLLIGWTYLSGTAMSLVGGDIRVPMFHKPRAMCRRSDLERVMTKS